MTPIDWNKLKHIHCIGVGGIGLSALAQLLAGQGREVSGCDRDTSAVTEMLSGQGIHVARGHDAAHISSGIDLLIYSDAIEKDNPERLEAAKLHIPELSYFEALGQIANASKCLIAVCGAHGKTSTTAMLTDVLEKAGLNPTAVVGSLRAQTKSNFRSGGEDYFVVEADEYLRHFLNFTPKILVITNIDSDHLDYFHDLRDIESAFRELAKKVPYDGFIVCNTADEKVKSIIADLGCTIVNYLDYFDPALPMQVLLLNRINAAAVLAVGEILKVDQTAAKQTLSQFAGTWRRFEYKGKTKDGAVVYDDYAHHPAEIGATLRSIKEQFPGKKIIVVFHPHLYSRTKLLLNDFGKAFKDADEVLVAPIFAAREEADPAISHHILAQKIADEGKKVQALDSFEEIETYLRANTHADDLILTMGAGDIYRVADRLVKG